MLILQFAHDTLLVCEYDDNMFGLLKIVEFFRVVVLIEDDRGKFVLCGANVVVLVWVILPIFFGLVKKHVHIDAKSCSFNYYFFKIQ